MNYPWFIDSEASWTSRADDDGDGGEVCRARALDYAHIYTLYIYGAYHIYIYTYYHKI